MFLYTKFRSAEFHSFSLVIAAIVHDYRHPSVSESFLIATNNPLALRYNNDHVTQRFALAEFFKTIKIGAISRICSIIILCVK